MHDLVEQLPPGFTDTFQSRFVEVNDITLHTVIVGAVGPEPRRWGHGARLLPGAVRVRVRRQPNRRAHPCLTGHHAL